MPQFPKGQVVRIYTFVASVLVKLFTDAADRPHLGHFLKV